MYIKRFDYVLNNVAPTKGPLLSLFLDSIAKTCFRAITPSLKILKALAEGHL